MNSLPQYPEINNGWEGRVFRIITEKIIAKCQDNGCDWQRFGKDFVYIEMFGTKPDNGHVSLLVSAGVITRAPQLFEIEYREDPTNEASTSLIEGAIIEDGSVCITKYKDETNETIPTPITAGELEQMLHIIASV